MEAGLSTTTRSSVIETRRMVAADTGTSCLQSGYLLYTVSVTQRRFYSHYRWLIHSLPLLCLHNSLFLSVLLLFFQELVCVETFIGRGAGGVVRTQLVHSLKMSCVNKHELLLQNLITMSDNIYYNRQGAGRRDMTADSRHLAPPDST